MNEKERRRPKAPGRVGVGPPVRNERGHLGTSEHRVIAPKIGRPSKYDPALLPLVKGMASKLGLVEFEIRQALGIDTHTFTRWKLEHPAFRSALTVSRRAANKRVEISLYHRANGYSYESEEIHMVDAVTTRIAKDGTKSIHRAKRPLRVPIIEHVPPSEGAAKLWLTNRDEKRWRERKVLEHTNKDGESFKTEDVTPAPPVDLVDAYLKRMARAARGRADPGTDPNLGRDGRSGPGQGSSGPTRQG